MQKEWDEKEIEILIKKRKRYEYSKLIFKENLFFQLEN